MCSSCSSVGSGSGLTYQPTKRVAQAKSAAASTAALVAKAAASAAKGAESSRKSGIDVKG